MELQEEDYGYRLYNEETAFFSWHDTPEDADHRARYEQATFGRNFRIAKMTRKDAEWYLRPEAL